MSFVGNAGVLSLGRPGLRTGCDNNTVYAVNVMAPCGISNVGFHC